MSLKIVEWFPGITISLDPDDEEIYEIDFTDVADGSTISDMLFINVNCDFAKAGSFVGAVGSFGVTAGPNYIPGSPSYVSVQAIMPGRGKQTRTIHFAMEEH